jgi:glutamate--cysteine ligase
MVPHLVTALTGPINELEQRIIESLPAIERWFRLEWMEHTPPFYTSVDVRNAGFKLAPVDTNLFPSGFNNLTTEMLPLAVQAAMAAIEKICPEAKNLLLIPGPQTRNTFYLANIARLMQIFHMAGLNVRLGTLDESIKKPTNIELPDGTVLTMEPLIRERGRVGLKDFDPCTVLLNNDLSTGVPAVLENLHEQFLLPPLHAGWTVRRKSAHFTAYEETAKRFSKLMGIDPWLINPMFSKAENLPLTEAEGVDSLQTQADALLTKVRRKYKEYGINEKAFIVIKPDAGTSGLGLMTVRDAKDLNGLRERALHKFGNKFSAHNDGGSGHVGEVILQEGVPTYERVNDAVAEPVVTMIDRYVVGGYYRVNAARAVDENLNSPGAAYVPLAFAESNQLPKPGSKPGASAPNRFYMYGVIARLAMVAASYELEATDPNAEVYD